MCTLLAEQVSYVQLVNRLFRDQHFNPIIIIPVKAKLGSIQEIRK